MTEETKEIKEMKRNIYLLTDRRQHLISELSLVTDMISSYVQRYEEKIEELKKNKDIDEINQYCKDLDTANYKQRYFE